MENTLEVTTVESLQRHLISRVQSIRDVDKLVRFLIFLDELPIPEENAKRIFMPIRRNTTLEDLKREQNFKGTDWKKANEWAKSLDIQESAEELIAQLTK
jgi:hypothetical protein